MALTNDIEVLIIEKDLVTVEFVEKSIVTVELNVIDVIPAQLQIDNFVLNEVPTKITAKKFQTEYAFVSGTLQ